MTAAGWWPTMITGWVRKVAISGRFCAELTIIAAGPR
ncbi:MAG: hypothetical protein QOH17_1586 [Pseudonocardiales bacterium]|jgi:hypothetical protein|nr:hypothetical protein [Pseudonocardiales bacterium]